MFSIARLAKALTCSLESDKAPRSAGNASLAARPNAPSAIQALFRDPSAGLLISRIKEGRAAILSGAMPPIACALQARTLLSLSSNAATNSGSELTMFNLGRNRSEERRVGKEWRQRWGLDAVVE